MIPDLAVCVFESQNDSLINDFIQYLADNRSIKVSKVDLKKHKTPSGKHDHLLMISPEEGFDEDQAETVKKILVKYPAAQLLILGDESMFNYTQREEAPVIDLYTELEKNIAMPLIWHFHNNPKYKKFRDRALNTFLDKARLNLKIKALLKCSDYVMSRVMQDTYRSWDHLEDVNSLYKEKLEIEADIKTLCNIKENLSKLRKNDEENKASMYELKKQSYDLSQELIRRTSYVSRSSLDISDEMHKPRSKMLSLICNKWVETPNVALKTWADDMQVFLLTPRFLLPVVGIFSSGKTTFFNEILGRTPGGKPCLRTSGVHNTAALLVFHHKKEGEPNKIDYQWKQSINHTLVRNDMEQPAIKVPFNCVVEKVTENGPIVIITVVSDKDHSKTDFLEVPKEYLKKSVKPGIMLKQGEKLTRGADLDLSNHENLAKHIKVNINAVSAMSDLFAKGFFTECEIIMRRYDNNISGSSEGNKPQRINNHKEIRNLLRRLTKSVANPGSSIEQPIIDNHLWGNELPLNLTFSAMINHEKLPKTHTLETDEDWDEFQGCVLEELSGTGRKSGFSESLETAWLLEKGNVYLDNQLFESVNMVDTPGLKSIDKNHELITLDYIGRGDAFIIMVKLDKQVDDYYISKILYEISKKLIMLENSGRIKHSEWQDRIFIVLNWFHRYNAEEGVFVPSLPEVEAKELVARLERNVEIVLNVPITAYVVDLSANVNTDRNSLLGRPSIKPLLESLKHLIKEYYWLKEIRVRRTLLEKNWIDINNSVKNITEEKSEEELSEIKRTLSKLEEGGRICDMLYNLVFERLENLKTTVKKISKLVFSGKDDFMDNIDPGVKYMKFFNKTTVEISKGLPDELVSILRKNVAKKSGLFDVTAPEIHGIIEHIPVYHDDEYSRDLTKIHENYPHVGKRIWHLLSRFKHYSTTKGNEIRHRYFPANEQDKRLTRIDEIADKLNYWIRNTCYTYHQALQERLKTMEMDRKTRIEEQGIRMKELAEFKPVYEEMISILDDIVMKNS